MVESAVGKFYINAFNINVCLNTNNIESAEEALIELRNLGSRFIEPDMAHYIDLLTFNIMFKRKNFDALKKSLIDKLKQLLDLGYCKQTYFRFFVLLLDVYIELKDFNQVSNLVDNNINITVQYNLELYYYLLKAYEMRVYIEIGNLDKAHTIYKDTKLGVNKTRNKVRALFYYTSSLLFIKLDALSAKKGQQTESNLYKDLKIAIESALSIMDVELLKKLTFLAAIINDSYVQPLVAEIWSKKYLQVDSIEAFVQKNYRRLDMGINEIGVALSFNRKVYKLLHNVIDI